MRNSLFLLFIIWSAGLRAGDVTGKVRIEASKVSGCAPLSVEFLSATDINKGNWRWEFGNGYISNSKTPSVVFLNEGTYTVRLIVSNGREADSASMVIQVYKPATPATPLKDMKDASFNPVSPANYGVYASYGADVLVVDNKNPIKPWCEGAEFKTEKPLVGFTGETTGCIGGRVNFINYTQNATSYLWEYGDGEKSTNQKGAHVYQKNGYYDVSLTAYNSEGCEAKMTLKRMVHIDTLPVDFEITASRSLAPPYLYTFNSVTQHSKVSYIWDFGDGGTDTHPNTVHVYDAPGDYAVRLVAYTRAGCTNSKLIKHTVKIGATAAAQ